jgi:hypothetical protein
LIRKKFGLLTHEAMSRAEKKNLFWADAALKKEGYTKIAKNSQQACKLLFSWGWMVDKLVRLIFREKWRASHKLGYPTQFSRNFQRQISP